MKYKESVKNSKNIDTYCVYYKTIDSILEKMISFVEETKMIAKNLSYQRSEYLSLNPERFGSWYIRFGSGKSERFGHENLCLSNISLPPNKSSKGIFSVILEVLSSYAEKNKIILSVENPLEERFQKYLERSGFECFNKQSFGLGVYYYMLKESEVKSNIEFSGLTRG